MMKSPEKFLNIVSSRQSVRSYRKDPVSLQALERCVEAAQMAPSANNGQPWEIIIAGDDSVKGALAKAAKFGILGENPFAAEAPVIVAVVESPGHRPTSVGGKLLKQDFPQMDIGMAVENFCLQATVEGLGTCILGLFVSSEVRKALNLPRNRRPRLLITVGFPVETEVRLKKRRAVSEMSRYIRGMGIKDAS